MARHVSDDDAELAVGKREHVVIIAAGVEAGAVVGGKVAPIPLGSAAGRMRRCIAPARARAPADRGCAASRSSCWRATWLATLAITSSG